MSTTYFNNSSYGKNVEVFLYIAGVEVPCENTSISLGQGRFLEFTATVPPDPLLHRFGADDKVPGAVFYLDHHAYKEPTLCLLCEGELSGWSYTSTGQNTSISFQFVDELSILTQLFIHFISDVDSALGANAAAKTTQAQGNVVTLNVLPLAFMYQFLNPKGPYAKPVTRPVDILLNILASVAGFSKSTEADGNLSDGVQIYSRQGDLARAINAAKKSAGNTESSITGDALYNKAKTLVNVGTFSPVAAKQGPREFSKAGLLKFLLNSANVSYQPFESPQELYSQCVASGTIQDAALIGKIPGALMFESSSNSLSSITSFAIIGRDGQAIEVLDSERTTTSDDGFTKIHDYVAEKYESGGNPGKVIEDVSPNGVAAGISVGLLQHNQRYGSLFELCRAMRSANSAKFDSLMGGALGINMFLGAAGGFRGYNFSVGNTKDYWYPRFSALFSDPEFVGVQYAFAKDKFFSEALSLAQKYDIDSETGIALLFDSIVDIGMNKTKALLTRVARSAGTDKDKMLTQFAYYADGQQPLISGDDNIVFSNTAAFSYSELSPQVAVTGAKTGEALVASARTLIGTPYGPDIGGPTARGFENYLDCSGTIFKAAQLLGVKIPRGASGQYLRCLAFQPISAEEARKTPGALVFFHKPKTEGKSSFHVELSVGDGTVIHNMNPKTRVKITKFGWWTRWMAKKGYTNTYGVLPDFSQ